MRRLLTLIFLTAFAVQIANAVDIHVATTGNDSNFGTADAPLLTIHKAVEMVKPGDHIKIHAGTYTISERIKIPKLNTSASNRCYMEAAGDGEVIIDGSAMKHTVMADFKMGRCIYVNHEANYWTFDGLTLQNAEDNGMKVEGSYNIIRNCVFRWNNDTGLQIGMYKDFSIEETKQLPAGEPQFNPGYQFCRENKVFNCDAYENADLRSYNGSDDGGDADGFACKLFPGPGTEFHGCRAWTNSDDNWDLYMVYHPVTIDSCWAYHAGYTKDGQAIGNGNGFKLGGGGTSGGAAFDQSVGAHVVTNCVSFDNLHKGYDQNNAYEGMYIINCTGWGNEFNYRFPTEFKYGNMFIRNCIGFKPTQYNHEFLSQDKGGPTPNTSFNSWTTIDNCNPYKENQKNSDGVKKPTTDWSNEFESLAVADFMAPREADGSLPKNSFARLKQTSTVFRDKGTPIVKLEPKRFMTDAQAQSAGLDLIEADFITIDYNDAAPDFGAFEQDGTPADIDHSEIVKASLECTSANASQTIVEGESIQPIVFVMANQTSYSVDGLNDLDNVNYKVNGNTITITGKPSKSFSYSISASGEYNTVKLSGTITVKNPFLREWVFTGTPAGDFANDENWKTDSKSRYCYIKAMNDEIAVANGKAIGMTQTLRFTIPANSAGNLRFGGSTNAMWLGDQCSFTIPACRKGDYVKVEYMTSNKSSNRTPTATNLAGELLSTTGTTHVTAFVEIADDGDVTISVPGGLYFYNLKVGPKEAIEEEDGGGSSGDGGTHVSPDNPDNPKDTEHAFDITRDFSKLHEEMFGNGPKIYVSPTGDDKNDGLTPETPIKDIQLAVDKALDPGTTIILAPGEYRPTDRININDRNGTHDNYNAMVCLDGRAVINCNHPYHKHSDNPYQGVRLTSSYWYFYHVDITNASDNGMLIERNKPTGGSSADIVAATDQAHDNVIDACNFYKNGDTGLQMKNLASYNYVINCDAYLNCDEGQGDADGFAPKISVGTGNYFFGCRAYLNSDDGWDVFYKKDGNFGDNMTIILDNCISYKNGFLDENTIAADGNGNGFKCGSDQGAMNVYMNRCLAVLNKAKGFDQNHNSGDIILNNCTGMTSKSVCGDKAYSYRIYETISSDHKVELNNCIAINDNDEKDKRDSSGATKVSEHGKQGDYGRFEIDETLAGLTINNCEFQKAHPSLFTSLDHAQLMLPRVNDQLPEIQFAHINPTAVTTYTTTAKQSVTVRATSLVDCGTMVNASLYRELPVLPISFLGSAPDLGAYEAIDPTDVQSATEATGYKVQTTGSYNLNGQRVNGSYRGVVITNGKKIVKR